MPSEVFRFANQKFSTVHVRCVIRNFYDNRPENCLLEIRALVKGALVKWYGKTV